MSQQKPYSEKRIDVPIGKLVRVEPVMDMETHKKISEIEVYEVEVLGVKCYHYHIPEYEPKQISWVTREPYCEN